MKRVVIIVVVAAVAVVALLLWSQRRTGPYFVSGFIESHQVRVGSRVGGRVARVHVEEGQPVEQGTPLLELAPFDLHERLAESKATLAAQEATLALRVAGPRQEEIEAARAARDRAQAELDEAIAGPRPQEIAAAEARLARTKAEMEKAQKDFARVKALAAEGQAAGEETDEVTRAAAVAEAGVAEAREELALLRAGTRAEQIAAARARLAEAEQTLAQLEAGTRVEEIIEAEAVVASARANVAALEQQIAELVVRAPLDGVIEAVELRPGDLIAPNAPVIALSDPSEMWVRAYLPENRLDVQLGRQVVVRVDSFPDRRFAAHISFISRAAEFTPANLQTYEERIKQVFRIKAMLDEGRDVLRAGMTADVFLEQEE
jgi:multidrug resistance efflux pump